MGNGRRVNWGRFSPLIERPKKGPKTNERIRGHLSTKREQGRASRPALHLEVA
jgi:hypothetical protein